MRPPRSPSLLALALALSALVSVAPPARAAEPTPSEISVARRLFDEGKSAEDAGRWREAAEKFRQAAAIKDTPGIRFHLARCEEEQGAFVEALVEYDRARELIDRGVKAPDVERLLGEARERVRAKVALITLRLPADVPNADVSVDGKAVSKSVLDVQFPINPGRHRLQARSPGRAPFDQEIQLGNGEAREVAIVLPLTGGAGPASGGAVAASDSAAPPRTPPARSPRPASRDAFVSTRTIVMVGEASLLAAGLGTGIISGLAHTSANNRFEAAKQEVLDHVGGSDPDGTACNPPEPVAGCAELERARADRSRAGTIATIGFVTAGVSAVALGLTWWLWPSGSAPDATVAVGRDGAALSLTGSF